MVKFVKRNFIELSVCITYVFLILDTDFSCLEPIDIILLSVSTISMLLSIISLITSFCLKKKGK